VLLAVRAFHIHKMLPLQRRASISAPSPSNCSNTERSVPPTGPSACSISAADTSRRGFLFQTRQCMLQTEAALGRAGIGS
jgi:hypothetical protein